MWRDFECVGELGECGVGGRSVWRECDCMEVVGLLVTASSSSCNNRGTTLKHVRDPIRERWGPRVRNAHQTAHQFGLGCRARPSSQVCGGTGVCVERFRVA